MEGVQGTCDLVDDVDRLLRIEPSALVNAPTEIGAFDEPHCDVEVVLPLARVEDGRQVRMRDLRGDLRLATEAGLRRVRRRRGQHLQGYYMVHFRLASAEDLAHASCTNERFDLVAGEPRSGQVGNRHDACSTAGTATTLALAAQKSCDRRAATRDALGHRLEPGQRGPGDRCGGRASRWALFAAGAPA